MLASAQQRMMVVGEGKAGESLQARSTAGAHARPGPALQLCAATVAVSSRALLQSFPLSAMSILPLLQSTS